MIPSQASLIAFSGLSPPSPRVPATACATNKCIDSSFALDLTKLCFPGFAYLGSKMMDNIHVVNVGPHKGLL